MSKWKRNRTAEFRLEDGGSLLDRLRHRGEGKPEEIRPSSPLPAAAVLEEGKSFPPVFTSLYHRMRELSASQSALSCIRLTPPTEVQRIDVSKAIALSCKSANRLLATARIKQPMITLQNVRIKHRRCISHAVTSAAERAECERATGPLFH